MRNQHHNPNLQPTTSHNRVDTNMDYSASIHDPEHPVGGSPWGSSPSHSPEHSRTTFPSDISDFAAPAPSNGLRDSQESEGFDGGDISGYQRPGTASTVDTVTSEASVNETPVSNEPAQVRQEYSTHEHSHDDAHSNVQQQQPQGQKLVQPQPPAAQQQARRPPPQFKLQAKISGLERTGRKDPIMRFDVHVHPL